MSIFLNIIAMFSILIAYTLLHSVINVSFISIGLGKNSGLSFSAGFVSSLSSIFISTYLTYMTLGYFNTKLNFFPVLIWVILQAFGSAKDGVDTRILSANMSAIDKVEFKLNNGVELNTQIYIYLGQLWGLIIGGISTVIYLAFMT